MPCSSCCKRQNVNAEYREGPSTSAWPNANISQRGMTYEAPEDLLTFVTGSSWGRWRITIIFLFCLIMIFHGLNMFASELLLPEHLNFTCVDGEMSNNACYTKSGNSCTEFNYSQIYGYTLTEKWDLVCEMQWKIKINDIVFKAGLAIGFASAGFLADIWGRRRVLFVTLILQPCMGILVATSGTMSCFMVTRFFYGYVLAGTVLIAIVLTCEVSSNKWRTFNIGLLYAWFAIGLSLLPYIWMIFADSVKNILLISLPQIALILFVGVIRESPNWFLCKNKPNRAEAILVSVITFDGFKVPSAFRIRPVQITNVGSIRSIPLLSMLLPSTTLRVVLSVCCQSSLTFFLCGLVFAHVLEEKYELKWMLTVFGVVGLAAAVASTGLAYVTKHKVIIVFGSIFGCMVAAIGFTFVAFPEMGQSPPLELSLQIIAYFFFISASFAVFNVAPRIFPTEMRAQGTGVTIALSELSITIARLISANVYQNLSSFFSVFCGATLLILLSCISIPSVHNRELPDLLEDTINFRHTHKPTRWTTIRAASPTVDETEIKITDFERETSIVVQHAPLAFAKAKRFSRDSQYTRTSLDSSKS